MQTNEGHNITSLADVKRNPRYTVIIPAILTVKQSHLMLYCRPTIVLVFNIMFASGDIRLLLMFHPFSLVSRSQFGCVVRLSIVH